MSHTCHNRACRAHCPPKMLTCRRCWALVPPELQRPVCRTVGQRKMGGGVDASWAPWWRAQALAINAAMVNGAAAGLWTEARPGAFADELAHVLEFADYLDGTIDNDELERRRAARAAALPAPRSGGAVGGAVPSRTHASKCRIAALATRCIPPALTGSVHPNESETGPTR